MIVTTTMIAVTALTAMTVMASRPAEGKPIV
jgi:hypothetical protein